MGISSRDYVRESSGRAHGFGDETPACKWLVIITVVVFVLQLVLTHPGRWPGHSESYIDDWFALDLDGLMHGQVWRLVTYAFLHDRETPWHILFNMLGLWWFGTEVERLYGTREFTLFYLVSAAASGVGFAAWQLAMGFSAGAIGASGAVLAVLTLFATHYPRHRIYIYGIIPVEVRWLIALYVVMDLWPVLQALDGEEGRSGIAHSAHLIGILFGWIYRRRHWHFSSMLDGSLLKTWPRRWRQARSKQTLRVFDPEPQSRREPEVDLESELDRILAKIHEHGSGSLTDREQAILTRASQQYKDRK